MPPDIDADYQQWARKMFPAYVAAPFADRHNRLLAWAWEIVLDEPSRPFVSIASRGGGKSTIAELCTVALGARNKRKYAVYVRRTQDKADDSVSNIGRMLESAAISNYYAEMGKRSIGKFGKPSDWRRQRLRTASGWVVDALGLDTARGFKVDEQRPDMFIFDDIDDPFDSPKMVQKVTDIITKNILPAGSSALAVLCVQNLIRSDGFFGKMVSGSADYLADRILDGPHPAITDFTYEQRRDEDTDQLRWYITGGTPTWAGQSLAVCQNQINTWGLNPFRQEAQHEVDLYSGGMYEGIEFQHIEPRALPPLIAVEVWVDPAITSGTNSNCQGIQCDGVDEHRNLYRLWSWEGVTSPEKAIERAIQVSLTYNARAVGIETDQGGDIWALTYNNTFKNMQETGKIPLDARKPQFKSAKAGSIGGKIERQNMMRSDYDSGHIFHVIGTHKTLEAALLRFPLVEPLDLADSAFYGWLSLRHKSSWTR